MSRVTDQPIRLGDARPDESEPPPADAAPDETVQAPLADAGADETDGAPLADAGADETDEAPLGDGGPGGPFWRRRSTVLVAAVLGGVLVLYLGAYLIASGHLASGATVLGVEVGGLSPAVAEEVLSAELPALVDSPMTLRVADDESTFSLVPPEAGLTIDISATVDAVPGASANPISIVRALLGVGAVDPVPAVDREALEAALNAIAEQADIAPVNGSVGFEDGEVVTSAAVPGRSVDITAAADAVTAAYFGTDGPHELPLGAVDLATTETDLRSATPRSSAPLPSSLSPQCSGRSRSSHLGSARRWSRRSSAWR